MFRLIVTLILGVVALGVIYGALAPQSEALALAVTGGATIGGIVWVGRRRDLLRVPGARSDGGFVGESMGWDHGSWDVGGGDVGGGDGGGGGD